jgi:hypothetical protein
MKGHQLLTLKSSKSKHNEFQNTFGYVQGKSSVMQSIGPRTQRQLAQIYLKNVSKYSQQNITKINSKSDTTTQTIVDVEPKRKTFLNFTIASGMPKPEVPLDFQLEKKFLRHLLRVKRKELQKLDKELFPAELSERIHYLPDPNDSRLRDKIDLGRSSRRVDIVREKMYKTVKNIVKGEMAEKEVNLGELEKHKFATYSLGWGNYAGSVPSSSKRSTARNASVMNRFLSSIDT